MQNTIAKFVTLLHKTIQSALSEHIDEIWENGAKQLQEGWMHIHGKSITFCEIAQFICKYDNN